MLQRQTFARVATKRSVTTRCHFGSSVSLSKLAIPLHSLTYFGMAVNSVVGIDLGTSYSCVAVQRPSGVEIIVNDRGNPPT